ncbi:MAG: hypothetical protein QG622_3458 [Actinomycetota bacterium]|nr:hypothetical protein [Actinomycetota bacterium]
MSSSGRPARGRPRSFDKDRALDVALRAFWERGFEATPVAALAQEMGIGVPSLYAAFGDKRALFTKVVTTYGRTYGAFALRALEEEATARAGVARMLREAAGEYTAPGRPHGCLLISAATNCTPGSADVEQLLRGIRRANQAVIERRIAADVDAGALPPGTDPATLARLTGTVLQGMSQQARDGASRADLEAVVELVLRAWP